MVDRIELARLRSQASWGAFPIPVDTVRLIREGDDFRIETAHKVSHPLGFILS